MNRFASTRSDVPARQPIPGFAQWSDGSMDEDGIRYGFTTNALIRSTAPTAITIVSTQSTTPRQGAGIRSVAWSMGPFTGHPRGHRHALRPRLPSGDGFGRGAT